MAQFPARRSACCRSSAPAARRTSTCGTTSRRWRSITASRCRARRLLSRFQGKNGNLMKSPWPFAPAGQSGKMISTLLPKCRAHVDDIAFIHSMQSKTNTHGPGCVFMNTGTIFEGFPSAGAWVGYALGSENENLPAYVAIPDIRGEPPNGKANWSNGFLPAQYQAVVMAAQQPIRNSSVPSGVSRSEDAATRDFVRLLDEEHAAQNPGLFRAAGAHQCLSSWRPGCSFPRRRLPTSPAESAVDRDGSTAPTTRIRSRRPTREIACSRGGCWSRACDT